MARKLLNTSIGNSLVPTREEIAEILARVMHTQIEKPGPMKVPMAFCQAWADCMVGKVANRIESEYDKASDKFMAEVKKSFEEFMNELAKAIKKLEVELNR